ncbi:hemicentin-2-like [Oratosquilla oratoria]|uniref:hemicentin-2-like n=1 Tax=Oratosquilla oratoria TaxID=337810 RepID=UPI003F75E221
MYPTEPINDIKRWKPHSRVAGSLGSPTQKKEEEETTEQPKITFSKETTVKAGEDAKIDCKVDGIDISTVSEFQIKWNKMDKERPVNSLPISVGEKILMMSTKFILENDDETQTFSLKIVNVNEHDQGIYRCQIYFGEDQKINADIPVNIEKAAYFTENKVKTLTVAEGDLISIDCQPGGSPKPKVYWERIDEDIPFYGSRTYEANQLEIPSIERSHEGTYVCHADNGIGEPVSSKVIIEVEYSPIVKLDQEKIFTQLKEYVQFHCQAEGNPLPEVNFYKDGVELLGSSTVKVAKTQLENKQGYTLAITIPEANADHLGEYKCRSENSMGMTEGIAVVKQKAPPVIFKASRGNFIYDAQKTKGRNALPVVLECEAEGGPTPSYKWRKNGEPFIWEVNERFSLEEGTGNLLISDPTEEDNGDYQCIAYNELGTAYGDTVHFVNNVIIQFHGVDKDVYEMEAELGRPFKMSCPRATGFPEPTLTWVKAYEPNEDGEASLEFMNTKRTVVDPVGNLWMPIVSQDDESIDFKYICLGSNELTPTDFSMGSVVNLKVVPPYDGSDNANDDSINIETFAMYTSPKEVEFVAGEENTLWCVFGGEPLPVIRWSRVDGKPLDLDRSVTRNYGRTLVIRSTNMGDAGEYRCAAINSVGGPKTHTMKVEVIMAPKFKEELASQTVEEGALVVFTCEAEASTDVGYNWYINGRPVKDMVETPRRDVEGAKLTIKGAVKADIGNYACNATSSIGYAYGQAMLNVLPKDSPRPGYCGVPDSLQEEMKSLREAVVSLEAEVKMCKNTENEAKNSVLDLIAEKLGVFTDEKKPEEKSDTKEKPVETKTEEDMKKEEELVIIYSRVIDVLQDSEGRVDCVYLDLEKAFDKVPHSGFMWKLERIGGLGLFDAIGVPFVPKEWRFFIDGSTTSLKAVLLHNGNKFLTLSLAHSVCLKEDYYSVRVLLEAMQCNRCIRPRAYIAMVTGSP